MKVFHSADITIFDDVISTVPVPYLPLSLVNTHCSDSEVMGVDALTKCLGIGFTNLVPNHTKGFISLILSVHLASYTGRMLQAPRV